MPSTIRIRKPHDQLAPLFNETIQAAGDQLPTFEPVISHEEFMRRHQFTDWLYVTLRRES